MSGVVKKRRVTVYVDGFNLYFGMVEAGYNNLKWLDINKLGSSFLSHDQEITEVKYFTSFIGNDPPKEKRQRTYINALESTGVIVIRGKYERKEVVCDDCGHIWLRTNEKMTDVNIATHLIMDAMEDKFDIAFLITGDSDIVPAINIVNNKFAPKFVTVFFPPLRQNVSVREAARGSMALGRKKLQDCQFPNEVKTSSGFVLNKPTEWV